MGKWQRDRFLQLRDEGKIPSFHQPRFLDKWGDGAWQDEDVWIIGGGPSIKDVDLSELGGRKVISTNMGFTVCEPTLAYFGSVLLLMRMKQKGSLGDVLCPKVCLEAMVWNMPTSYGCYVLEVAERGKGWGTIKKGIPVFSNSGLVALNLADALGATRIFLLGFDMRGGEDGRTTNFHSAYPPDMRPPASHYDTYIHEFGKASEKCRAQVFNCNGESRLTAFPHMPYTESIR